MIYRYTRTCQRARQRNATYQGTTSPGTPPPSAATRPECAAQPPYAVVTNRAIPPIRNNQPRNCATTPGVSRQIRPDAHHGSTQDPWPKHPRPPQPPSDRQPRQAAIMSIVSAPIRQKSHPRPVKRDFRGTEHMPPPTSNRKRGVISTIALSKLTGPNSLKMACICEF